jgi:signal transduction histidine kinase/ligand-binding sensor domain-containing protein
MQPKLLRLKIPGLASKVCFLSLLFSVFQICSNPCFPQAPQTRVNIQLLGPEQGLPSRNTRTLAQDGRGFMWIGTGQELWRYDGYTFQNFTRLLTSSTGGGTLINQMQTDRKGNVWVAHNNGVSIIDPKSLTSVTIDPSRRFKSVKKTQNLNIFFDKHENTWIAISAGRLIKLDKNNISVALFTPPAEPASAFPEGRVINQLFEDTRNNLYAYSDSHFLDIIDQKGVFKRRLELMNPDFAARNVLVSGVVQSEPDSLIVYYQQRGTRKGWKRKYSFAKDTFGPITEVEALMVPTLTYPDSRGYEWYKSVDRFGFIKKNTGEFTDLTKQLQQRSGARTFFFASLLSSDNSFWISTMDGLFKISLSEEVFHKYLSGPLEKPGAIGSSIRGITEDASGRIWACSYGYYFYKDGIPYMLHQIDPITRLSRHLQLNPAPNSPADSVIPYKVLFTGDQVYAITDGTQFIKINAEKDSYQSVAFPVVSGRGFTSFYKLNDHTFWMGTWGGMAMIDTKDLKPILFNDREGRYIKNMRINHFLPWPGNRILVSTTNGLYVLNQDATIHEHYGQETNDKIKLPALQIFHAVWHENALWAGSTQGLIRIDTLRKQAQLFTTQDGLPDNNIYAALPDERGNLWLSTNNGLSRFNTRTQKFRNYGISDGLPHTEFNHGSYLKAKNGTLYFGGLNGIVAFDPAHLDMSSQEKHKLQLIAFSKYDADQNKTDTVTNHQSGREIAFNPGDRLFTFTFMSPDYQNTALNRFRYKLEGWDDDEWQIFQSGNKLLLNSLPAGTYKLRVQVSVAGADWGDQEWQAAIRVLAPWYKSPWFFVLSMLAVGVVVYLISRYRLRQILHIQQIRNGISADMHDEIGSTLSSITFYSQALLMQMDKSEHQQVVQKIKDNAQQVQEGLSDIVWSVKAGNDEIEDVFARMFHFGTALAESKGIVFHFEKDPMVENIKLDMQTRKNLYLIFKEAMNNAAKYAECSIVNLKIMAEPGKMKMTISDDGKGFDRQVSKQGNGLTNMEHRAAQMKGKLVIHSMKGEGTSITLVF